MKRIVLGISCVLLFSLATKAQNPEVKFIADTLAVQADGTFEADPDLATLTFDISSQDKELKAAYDKASQAMQNIVALAEKNGLKKDDISSGALTVTPYYGGDRKKARNRFSCRDRSRSKFAISQSSAQSWSNLRRMRLPTSAL